MVDQSNASTSSNHAVRFGLSALISVGALALGVAHLLFPDVRIDSNIIVLLLIAIAPWLAPLFKSIELPGGWKFEFKEFQRQVQEDLRRKDEKVQDLRLRVQRVEKFAFSGSLDQAEKQTLNNSLASYHNFLKGLGFDLDKDPPSVFVDADLADNAYYDGDHKQIVIGKPLAHDLDVLYREYTHHALMANAAVDYGRLYGDAMAIESGIADYLPCSFKDDPKFGEKAAAVLRKDGGFDEPSIRNLRNSRTFVGVRPTTSPQEIGEIWGGALWDIRTFLGKDDTDAVVAAAWLSSGEKLSSMYAGTEFIHQLTSKVETKAGRAGANKVSEVFEIRKYTKKSTRGAKA